MLAASRIGRKFTIKFKKLKAINDSKSLFFSFYITDSMWLKSYWLWNICTC